MALSQLKAAGQAVYRYQLLYIVGQILGRPKSVYFSLHFMLLLSLPMQGDVKFAEVLEQMGAKVSWTETSVTVTGPPRDPSKKKCLRGIDVNMNKIPDVAMTLAVIALFADGPTVIRDGKLGEKLF